MLPYLANIMDEVIEVKVARTHNDALLPSKGSVHAAGWDLYSLEDTIVKRRSSTMVRTGLHVAIPEGFEGQVRARSSLGKKGLILPHSIGTIDADYRGELFVLMTWIGEGDSYLIQKKERKRGFHEKTYDIFSFKMQSSRHFSEHFETCFL